MPPPSHPHPSSKSHLISSHLISSPLLSSPLLSSPPKQIHITPMTPPHIMTYPPHTDISPHTLNSINNIPTNPHNNCLQIHPLSPTPLKIANVHSNNKLQGHRQQTTEKKPPQRVT
ncbi:hypothetical protein KC19_7G165800 [Ceratodon purpureus]|uniref:Uncharacterized protein n=1 Tax=Ceratodon purpureus TaxID=3225 RepID=A0A8T0H9D1_CERPU|nr:hypothetical protein KC19_7G165800 [Ceratodon purpureus]